MFYIFLDHQGVAEILAQNVHSERGEKVISWMDVFLMDVDNRHRNRQRVYNSGRVLGDVPGGD